MLKPTQILLLVCALAAVESRAASVVQPIPALNAIKGPDLKASAKMAVRPVWTLDVMRDAKGKLTWQYAAVESTGKRLATFGHVDKPLTGGQAFAVSWAPDGKRYAFTSVTKVDGSQVNIKTVGGGQKVVRVAGSRVAVPWQLTWSPDGRRLAFLTYAREQGNPTMHSLVIMDAEWGTLKNPFVAEYRVPARTLAGFPPIMAPPDKLRWSPDGQRILISWGDVVVIDVRDGALKVIHPERAAATWTPRGDGILYLAVSDSGQRSWTGLNLQRLDGSAPVQIADAARLSQLGLLRPGLNSGILDLSPDGKWLALAGGDGNSRHVLHVFPVDAEANVQLENQRPLFTHGGTIFALDWAPEGRDLAVSTILFPNTPTGAAVPFLVTAGIVSATGTTQMLGTVRLPASTEFLDFLGQTRVLSWSR